MCGLPLIFVLYFSYREKAMQDAATVSKHVERLLQSVGKVCCQPMFSLNKSIYETKILPFNLGLKAAISPSSGSACNYTNTVKVPICCSLCSPQP